MEILLVLIYVSICVAIFKIFRIPVNQWSLSTAALGGIVGIFLLLLVMNYNHPFTKNARIYFPVTPILSNVKGRVIDVPVHTNTALKEGDVLFKIDPKPYEYVVAEKKALLAEAEQNVKQLKASLDRRTNSAAISARRSLRPSAHRYWIARVWPSIQPSSRNRCTRAATHWLAAEGLAAPRKPIVRNLPGCCACPASGHAAAAPLRIEMNSRRLIASPGV